MKKSATPNLLMRISVRPDVCHGVPCVRGTRIMVSQVLDFLASGLTPDEITSEEYFPDLTLQDILACIAFANQHVQNEEIHFFEEFKRAS